MNEVLKESFEWVSLANLPESNKLKIIAKTPKTTIHPETPEFERRVFLENELFESARSLIGRPVGLNHEGLIYGAYVADAQWNSIERQVEAILAVPEVYIQKVREKLIEQCSVEFGWRDTKKTAEGTAFEGLWLQRVDLLEGLRAGDSDSQVMLFESKNKGRIIMKIEEKNEDPQGDKPNKLVEGCVWSTKWASPEACIAANQDKEDPEAYCMNKIGESATEQDGEPEKKPEDFEDEESCKKAGFFFYDNACHAEPKPEEPSAAESSVEDPTVSDDKPTDTGNVKPTPDTLVTQEDCEKAGYFWDGEFCKPEKPPEPTVEELKEAMQRTLKTIKELKESRDQDIAEATKEAKEEVLKLVEAKIPSNFIVGHFNMGAKRFVYDVKRVLRECRKTE